jgi:hypothetical protein
MVVDVPNRPSNGAWFISCPAIVSIFNEWITIAVIARREMGVP